MKISNYKRDFLDEEKICMEKLSMKVSCSNCGRKVSFYSFEKDEKKICDWCGHYVFKNERAKLKHELKIMMIKKKKENKND